VREARALVDDGCAWLLALTHQDADADRRLAAALAGLPALVLGGHEHTSMDETIDGIRVLKAGAEATHAWIVDAVWISGPPAITARLEPTAGYAEDAKVRALVDAALGPVRALATATVLELAPGEMLSSIGTRRQQTSLGELVCSRLRDTLDADACVFNGGGIRAAREYHDRLSYGDLETEIPFDNELVVVALPGHVLERAIVASRAGAPVEHGGFLQVDDRIEVKGDHLVRVAGAPFDPARTYHVALIRDLCSGLDHIEPLAEFARAHPEVIPPPGGFRLPREVLVRSFARTLCVQLGGFAALDANHDGRIDPDELGAAMARRDGTAPSRLAGEIVVKALDRDRDGAIQPDELDDD
jgi:2',3'-cyclic-nucleotide 2'-phosphodiesterase (5'-nucleotidase family)